MKSIILLGAAVLLAACDTPTAPAPAARSRPNAAVLVNERFETATFAVNDCDGSFLPVTATFHYVFGETVTPSGNFHLKVHDNIEASGASAAGTDYRASEEVNTEENLAAAVEETSVEHFNLISQGSAPNEVAQITFHITITPDGNVSAYHDNFAIKCTG